MAAEDKAITIPFNQATTRQKPGWKDMRDRIVKFCLPSSSRQRDPHRRIRQFQYNMDFTTEESPPPPPDWVSNFGVLTDEDTISKFHEQFSQELDWLKDAIGTIEESDRPTIGSLRAIPEGDSEELLTPSQFIYGKDYSEVNRTCVSVLCLKWLMKRDYDKFTANQPPAVKLTGDSFHGLCNIVADVSGSTPEGCPRSLLDAQALTALLVAVVVGDVGKSRSLMQTVSENRRNHEMPENLQDGSDGEFNHDQVVYQAAEDGKLPSFGLLEDGFRKDVTLGLKAGSLINVPQLAQAENVPGNLKPIEIFKHNQRAFLLKYVEVILDVSGAGGHVDSRSAIRMIEPVYQAYSSCRSALENIISGNKTLREGYNQVLQQRGKLLEAKGFDTLRADDPEQRALLRLMCMARVDDFPKARLMRAAFKGLRAVARQRLIDGLSVEGIEDGEAILQYYIPAVFAETFKVMKDASELKKIEALQSVMRFMERVYEGSKPRPGEPGKVTEISVGRAADIIRLADFKSNPSLLDELYISRMAPR